MLVSFIPTGGAAQSGWTSYPPLSVISPGQTMWLVGMIFLITSSLLGSVNFIVTIVQLRAKGMSWMRLPFFVWAQLVTAFLLLLAFPPLEAAGVMQLMDRLAGTSFFMPSGLVVSGQALQNTGGGNPLLWQHLFWFLAHPEVYVLILPALGIVAEVIANNTRKPLWGYRALVYSVIFVGFMSFIVWAHHMFMTGMGTTMSAFFQTTTMIISIPSVVILTALLLSLWGASIRFTTPMLFALAFLPMFGIGGLTGLPLGLAPSDIHLHDTYYVIGHFHYVVAPGTIFALFAGIYYWFPKATGRQMNELLGKIHFYGSFVCINIVFFPMLWQGLGGMNRRMYDGGAQYAHNASLLKWNIVIGMAAWALSLFQLPFIFNFFMSMRRGKRVAENPWDATTLEWSAPSPPGHGNFLTEPIAYRGPYQVQRTGCGTGLHAAVRTGARLMEMNIPYTVEVRPDTGLQNGKLGIWLFLASEVMLFGALFSSYIILRTGSTEWPQGELSVWLGMANTFILIGSSVTMVMAWASLKLNDFPKHRLYLIATVVLAGIFLVNKYFEYADHFTRGELPSHSTFLAVYFTLTGLHGIHILGGMVVMGYLLGPGVKLYKKNPEQFTNRIDTPACTGTSSTWSGSFSSRSSIFSRSSHAFRRRLDQEKHSLLPDDWRCALRVHSHHGGGEPDSSRAAARRDARAHYRDDQRVDGRSGLHAPEPREAVGLRVAHPDGDLLRRADVRAHFHDDGPHRHDVTERDGARPCAAPAGQPGH